MFDCSRCGMKTHTIPTKLNQNPAIGNTMCGYCLYTSTTTFIPLHAQLPRSPNDVDTLPLFLAAKKIEEKPIAVKKELGASCARCNDFNEYASPNTLSGKFVCYSCRSSDRRA